MTLDIFVLKPSKLPSWQCEARHGGIRRRGTDTDLPTPGCDNTRVERDAMAWISQRRRSDLDPRLATSPPVLRRFELRRSTRIPASREQGSLTPHSPAYHKSLLETTPMANASPVPLLEPTPRIISSCRQVSRYDSTNRLDSLGASPLAA